ncbi:chromosome segregation protein SMC [Ornithinibacillus sp. 4-3]|uniref:Chromosome partition protein Smc n=1 Tax=Ornithinibacillus sp. 4-3 TaxID=3231488 RepID=A0AB39HUY5_9BACI
MYLKRLESVGFKSFAERISVNFVKGVTAVVGPNGSGKSNITDAIRWVLGEQSVKSLRGSKMEDIIFQGSDTRKPLNVAEVTLVLDNSDKALPIDYEEVSVTRRVYRSGESEFYINKQACRLKDIIELFLDSGLGRDAFSTISQGKVEEIISSKPEDRRTIFEEAAGVLKYKQRKKKAELKLMETEENLSRVQDIIHEIDSQIGPLQKQAEIAKKYLEKKETLKQEEISLLITEIEQINEVWKKILAEIDEDKLHEIKLRTNINQQEAIVQKKKQETQKTETAIEQSQNDLLEITQQLEQSEGKRHLLDERLKHAADNKEKLEEQIKELHHQIDKVMTLFESEKYQLSQLHVDRNTTKQKLDELKLILTTDSDEISQRIEGLKADYIEVLSQQAAKRNEKQTITQQLNQYNGKETSLKQKHQELQINLEKAIGEHTQQKVTLDKEKEAFRNQQENLKHVREEFANRNIAYEEAREKLNTGYQMIAKLKSRKDILEEMKEDYQGFFHGVKAVLKGRENNTLNGIFGAVIELIDIPKEYIVAMETILGGQAQHIIVENEPAARDAIKWLKKTAQGRATFLPLTTIEPRFIPSNLLQSVTNHTGFIDIAANLVETDDKFASIIKYLMGNTVLARTLEDANDIARILKRRYRIVTLDGDIVNPGGSMSGGAVKKTNQSLFSREKDIQEANHKLQEYEERTQAFEAQITENKQKIDELAEQIKQDEVMLQNQQQTVQTLEVTCNELETKVNSTRDQLRLFTHEQQAFKHDFDDLVTRNKEVDKALKSMEEQLAKVQKEVDLLTKKENELRENRKQLQEDYHRYEVTLAEQEERYRSQREKTKNLEQQFNEYKEQQAKYEEQLSYANSSQNSEEMKAQMEEQIATQSAKKKELQNKLNLLRSERQKVMQSIEDIERELKEENYQLQQFMQALQEKEVKANRLDVELENRLQHLQTEYTITYEKAAATYEKTMDVKQTQQHVNQIKSEIRKLGTVNLGAIDEYERLSERFDFLTEQKDDLVEAKTTLYTIIAEMDTEMKKAFKETFYQIKDGFAHVFKELFGGGFAELNLTDPNDLLQTGVEIIARPPGKKLQNLGLLSGGEKALTAIALLFAILQVRPVPFCILDEAESALDEANVVRFARYIKHHRGDTQFIVITHRKGTMEEADVLYGVTMQELGVSRLVSVKLEDSLAFI